MTVRAKSRCSDVDIGHFAITNWVTCTFDTASSDVIAHKTEAMVYANPHTKFKLL